MAYEIDWKEKGTVFSFSGKLTIEQINEANAVVYGDARFDAHDYTIWDFLDSDWSSVTADEILVPAGTDWAASLSVPRYTVVLVVVEPKAVGLCQQYIDATQRMGSTWRFHIADSMDDAIEWLST